MQGEKQRMALAQESAAKAVQEAKEAQASASSERKRSACPHSGRTVCSVCTLPKQSVICNGATSSILCTSQPVPPPPYASPLLCLQRASKFSHSPRPCSLSPLAAVHLWAPYSWTRYKPALHLPTLEACSRQARGHRVPLKCRAEEERGYLREQQHELERKQEAASKAEADARAEAKHAQLRFEDRDHELGERAALLRRQEAELVSTRHFGPTTCIEPPFCMPSMGSMSSYALRFAALCHSRELWGGWTRYRCTVL